MFHLRRVKKYIGRTLIAAVRQGMTYSTGTRAGMGSLDRQKAVPVGPARGMSVDPVWLTF